MSQDIAASVRNLREKIDDHHRQALKALELISAYLSESPDKQAGGAGTGPGSTGKNDEGSIRDKVLRIIGGRWESLDRIKAETGLTRSQIRGVLYAPSLKAKIKQKKAGKNRLFKLKPDGGDNSDSADAREQQPQKVKPTAGIIDYLRTNSGATADDIVKSLLQHVESSADNKSNVIRTCLRQLVNRKAVTADGEGHYLLSNGRSK